MQSSKASPNINFLNNIANKTISVSSLMSSKKKKKRGLNVIPNPNIKLKKNIKTIDLIQNKEGKYFLSHNSSDADSQNSLDADEISLVDSPKNIKMFEKIEEDSFSSTSSLTLDLNSDIKVSEKSLRKLSKYKMRNSGTLKNEKPNLKKQKPKTLENNEKKKITEFLNIIKSIKKSFKHKKYQRKPCIGQNLQSCPQKPKRFSSSFDNLKSKPKIKIKKEMPFKLSQNVKNPPPMNITWNSSEKSLSKPSKIKDPIEIFLEEQLEAGLLNDENNLVLNENPLKIEENLKKRKRRTKKEMELYKILQKAVQMSKEQEKNTETKEKAISLKENNASEKELKKKRRTKKEIIEQREKEHRILTNLIKQQDFIDQDKDFHNPNTKNDLIDIIKMKQEQILSTAKKFKMKIKPKKLVKSDVKNKKTSEFATFLNILSSDKDPNKKRVYKRKILSEKKSQPIKKKKIPADDSLSESNLNEKLNKKRDRDGVLYHTNITQKWNKYDPSENEMGISKPENNVNPIKEFEGIPGIKLSSLNYANTPYDFFSQYLPEFIFEEVAKFTNISAAMAKNNVQKKNWSECTAQEIKDLFALFFLFELIKKQNVSDYWTQESLLTIPSIEKIMSLDRFALFKKFLTFYDKSKKNELGKEKDFFYKCKFLVGHILESCSNIYSPEKNLCLSEMLINYEGVLNIGSTSRHKGRNEINVAVLKEVNSGYIWNIVLSEGNRAFEKKDLFHILTGLEYKGYLLFMDSTFISISFLNELKVKHIGACGMVSLKKLKFQNETKREIKEIKKSGSSVFFTKKDLTVAVWNQYSRKVYALSNYHDCEMITIKKSRKIGYISKVEYKIYEYEAPKMIHEIIENGKGNDYINKNLSYFSIDYTSWKWYYRVMLYFLEICMMNSYLIYCKVYKQRGLKPISNLEYRIEIVKNLCKWTEKTTIESKKLEADNFEENVESVDDEKKKRDVFVEDIAIESNCQLVYIGVGFCQYCRRKRHKLKKTFFWCKACQYGLCVKCFDEHKMNKIIKKMKELDPIQNKNLIDLLITNQTIQASEVFQSINSNGFTKKFRRTKNQLNLLRKTTNQAKISDESIAPYPMLKRKRKPYRTRKNKLNQKDQSDPMIPNNNKNIEIKNMKILEQNSIGEELFEFSEDSLNETIKKKTKYQIFTPEKKLLEDKIEILDEDNFINIDEKKE